jgi:membrane-bound lytic murein transglycosylase MltF
MELKPKKNIGLLYVVLLLTVLLAMYGLHRCSDRGDMTFAGIMTSGGDTLDVAIEYAPPVCYTYKDTLGGLHYDMLRDIAAQHGLKLKFHPVTSIEKSLPLIHDNVVDLLVADVPMTAEFREQYRFLEPIAVDRQVLVQRRDSVSGVGAVRNAIDMGGDTVWVAAGSSVASRIHSLSREIGDTIYVKTESEYGAEQLAIMVAVGEIKHAVISRRIAGEIAKDYPQLDVVTEVSFSQFQSWIASTRHAAVIDSLDVWIKAYKTTPAYTDLLSRYAMQ